MKTSLKSLFIVLIALAISVPASAAYTLYDKDGASFSTDGSFNTFYVYSQDESTGQSQSRVKMGFLPNWIGFNFSKQVGNLKFGGRSSFWVSINDSGTAGTATGIDVRQFYGTVDGDFGQVLFGKDFTLFNRSNIFLDEILQGFGKTGAIPGLDAQGVSFGDIGSGYTYPMPAAQITYRTPDLSGFKIAVGIIDPGKTSGAGSEEAAPRFETEATFSKTFDPVAVTAWVGGLYQDSTGAAGDVTSTGVSYGLNAKVAGLSVTGSGFTGSGIGKWLGPTLPVDALIDGSGDEIDSDGYLVQASYTIDKLRLVGSYGKSTLDDPAGKQEDQTVTGAVFYSLNDYFKLCAEYNVETIDPGTGVDYDVKTIATGLILNF